MGCFVLKHEQRFFKLQIVLQSKIDEFRFLNYDTITRENLWTYCVDKKWRKKNVEELSLHEMVSTIFAVNPSEVIAHLNRKSVEASRNLVGISEDELEMLLGLNSPGDDGE